MSKKLIATQSAASEQKPVKITTGASAPAYGASAYGGADAYSYGGGYGAHYGASYGNASYGYGDLYGAEYGGYGDHAYSYGGGYGNGRYGD